MMERARSMVFLAMHCLSVADAFAQCLSVAELFAHYFIRLSVRKSVCAMFVCVCVCVCVLFSVCSFRSVM